MDRSGLALAACGKEAAARAMVEQRSPSNELRLPRNTRRLDDLAGNPLHCLMDPTEEEYLLEAALEALKKETENLFNGYFSVKRHCKPLEFAGENPAWSIQLELNPAYYSKARLPPLIAKIWLSLDPDKSMAKSFCEAEKAAYTKLDGLKIAPTLEKCFNMKIEILKFEALYAHGIAISHLKGRTFDEWQEGQPPKVLVKVFREICKIYNKLKNIEFVHGDVKPENILIHDTGAEHEIYLIDFETTSEQSWRGSLYYGTEEYLDPNHLSGWRRDDAALRIIAKDFLLDKIQGSVAPVFFEEFKFCVNKTGDYPNSLYEDLSDWFDKSSSEFYGPLPDVQEDDRVRKSNRNLTVTILAVLFIVVIAIMIWSFPKGSKENAVNPPSSLIDNFGSEFALIPEGGVTFRSTLFNELQSKSVPHFYLARHEVTVGLWRKIMGTVPRSAMFASCDDSYPVESISFSEAKEFISEINSLSVDSGFVYRLPTEEEFCRVTDGLSEDPSTYWSNENALSLCAQNFPGKGNAVIGPQPVGTIYQSEHGLFDLYGNVWEWIDVGTRNLAVIRGGSWSDPPGEAANAYKHSSQFRNFNTGFRLVLSLNRK